jgi:hypothetical protein
MHCRSVKVIWWLGGIYRVYLHKSEIKEIHIPEDRTLERFSYSNSNSKYSTRYLIAVIVLAPYIYIYISRPTLDYLWSCELRSVTSVRDIALRFCDNVYVTSTWTARKFSCLRLAIIRELCPTAMQQEFHLNDARKFTFCFTKGTRCLIIIKSNVLIIQWNYRNVFSESREKQYMCKRNERWSRRYRVGAMLERVRDCREPSPVVCPAPVVLRQVTVSFVMNCSLSQRAKWSLKLWWSAWNPSRKWTY